MNRKAIQAWEIYTRMETSAESLGKDLKRTAHAK